MVAAPSRAWLEDPQRIEPSNEQQRVAAAGAAIPMRSKLDPASAQESQPKLVVTIAETTQTVWETLFTGVLASIGLEILSEFFEPGIFGL